MARLAMLKKHNWLYVQQFVGHAFCACVVMDVLYHCTISCKLDCMLGKYNMGRAKARSAFHIRV
jgi:hypothetical protein